MSLSFVPTLLYYRLSPIWSAALPGIALLYMSYTLQSAYQSISGGEAASGRGASMPTRRACNEDMESVNLKTGLPAAPGDPKAIMEAFKPTQEPLGAVATYDAGTQQGAAAEEYGQAGPTPPIPEVVAGDAGPQRSPSRPSQKPPAVLRSKGTTTAGPTTPSPAPAPGPFGRIFGGF